MMLRTLREIIEHVNEYVSKRTEVDHIDLFAHIIEHPNEKTVILTTEPKEFSLRDCPDVDVKKLNYAENTVNYLNGHVVAVKYVTMPGIILSIMGDDTKYVVII